MKKSLYIFLVSYFFFSISADSSEEISSSKNWPPKELVEVLVFGDRQDLYGGEYIKRNKKLSIYVNILSANEIDHGSMASDIIHYLSEVNAFMRSETDLSSSFTGEFGANLFVLLGRGVFDNNKKMLKDFVRNNISQKSIVDWHPGIGKPCFVSSLVFGKELIKSVIIVDIDREYKVVKECFLRSLFASMGLLGYQNYSVGGVFDTFINEEDNVLEIRSLDWFLLRLLYKK